MSAITPAAPSGGRRLAKPAQVNKRPVRNDQRILLTLEQVLAELGGPGSPLPRSTWHDWQRRRTGPKVIRLPNSQIRVARDDLDSWLDSLTRNPADA
jgi:hypothetical protein